MATHLAKPRHESLQLLRRLATVSQAPWYVGGDFNEILNSSEKEGGIDRSPGLMNNFNNALMECQLIDLGFIGYPYTF